MTSSAHATTAPHSDLIYGLYDRPHFTATLFAALQHVLASFVGIITPPLVIGSALGLTAYLPYLISMALMVSGVGTFIQARRPFGIGAGMICLQGTSFAFLGAVLSAGTLVGTIINTNLVPEPVSGPRSEGAKLVFGFGAGLLIYLIRTWGSYPDGTAFAILLMNLAVPSLERLALRRQQAAR